VAEFVGIGHRRVRPQVLVITVDGLVPVEADAAALGIANGRERLGAGQQRGLHFARMNGFGHLVDQALRCLTTDLGIDLAARRDTKPLSNRARHIVRTAERIRPHHRVFYGMLEQSGDSEDVDRRGQIACRAGMSQCTTRGFGVHISGRQASPWRRWLAIDILAGADQDGRGIKHGARAPELGQRTSPRVYVANDAAAERSRSPSSSRQSRAAK